MDPSQAAQLIRQRNTRSTGRDSAPNTLSQHYLTTSATSATSAQPAPNYSIDNVAAQSGAPTISSAYNAYERAMSEAAKEAGGRLVDQWSQWGAPPWLAAIPGTIEYVGRELLIPGPGEFAAAGNLLSDGGAAMGALLWKGAGGVLDDLPTDQASRMARAREQGFDTDVYHGTREDFTEFGEHESGFGIHVGTKDAANVRLSDTEAVRKGVNRYATRGKDYGEDGNVIPLKARIKKPLRMDDVGEWNDPYVVSVQLSTTPVGSKNYDRILDLQDEMTPIMESFEDSEDWLKSPEAAEFLDELRDMIKSEGYDSVVYTNFIESSGGSSDSYILFNPSYLRSINAKFDPAKKDSSNLLAGIGAGAIGASYLLGNESQPGL